MENQQTNQELWAAEENWNGFLYFSKEDSRVLVPKKNKYMGWTLNFGHPSAPWSLLILLVGLPVLTSLLTKRFSLPK